MERFRNSFTQRQGTDAAKIVTGRIVNTNLVNWTVDVRSQFDRHWFFGIQVGSPYAHYNRGEGISVFPEVGAMCAVTIPSDSAPPFVSSFLMPHETIDAASADAPLGTNSLGDAPGNAFTATFAGGRPRAKPGDITLRTRDGNFVVLHRGGVLQIGSTELAQRMYLPLRNHVMDVSENFSHHNAGGTILWGIQEGQSSELPAQWIHTFRVFANDQQADIRIVAGKVHSPVPEPSGDAGETLNLQKLEIGTDKNNPIIYEVTVAPKGFNPESGDVVNQDVRKQTVLRFFFDRRGGTFLRVAGSLLIACKKKMYLHGTDEMTVQGENNINVLAKKGIDIHGGTYTHIKGDVVRLAGGSLPVARQGDMCRIMLPTAIVNGTLNGQPLVGGVLTITSPLYGTIVGGNSRVLA